MIWKPDEYVLLFPLSFREALQQLVAGEAFPIKVDMLNVAKSIHYPLCIVTSFVIHKQVFVQDVESIGTRRFLGEFSYAGNSVLLYSEG